MDYAANVKKEDRIVITGLTSKVPKPNKPDERKTWLRNIVGEILNKIVPESATHIVFTTQGSKNAREIPLVEVKLDNRELALKIRKDFAAKKKAGQDFGKIYIANSVTLGTRVRVDIMRAMAKRYSTEKEELFVMAFASRPVLQLRIKTEDRTMAFTFSDAIARYGGDLVEGELGEAYRRTGTAFRGQLQQNFVVLHEGRQDGTPRWPAFARKPRGDVAKRPRDEGSNGVEPAKTGKKTKKN